MGPPLRLDGYLVGVTADRRWEEQAELLASRGAAVLHAPTIRTRPLGSDAGMREALDRVVARPPDLFLANTGIGLRSWFAAAESWGLDEELFDALLRARIYARGPKAVAAVQQWGLDVVGVSPTERLDDLVALLARRERLAGCQVLFQQHGEDAPGLVSALERHGAMVDLLPVYAWTRPDDLRPVQRLIEGVVARRVHAVTVTSAPAVRNLVAIAEDLDLAERLGDAFRSGSVLLAGVGPGCAAAAAEAGLGPAIVPDRYRLGPMLRRLADALAATATAVELGGHVVVLHGTRLEVDGAPTTLAPREARVLAALAARAGKVVTKEALRREVWDDGGDARAVEVTVARLRRRLGGLGPHVVAVPRRGYLLEGRRDVGGTGAANRHERTNGVNAAFRTATSVAVPVSRRRRQLDPSG